MIDLQSIYLLNFPAKEQLSTMAPNLDSKGLEIKKSLISYYLTSD